ncbi:MAG TPA: hypothetical protein VGR03_14095 [Candidatus Acidoferrum sp.]|nr:hypothetical protein [Candidatus Acidoferrum sp.]
MFLDVWQIKELWAHFSDVWQIKDLVESGIDSKGFRVGVSGADLEVWIPKKLGELLIESKGVTDALASDNVEELSDSPDVWQVKGLEEEERELGNGALAGGAGRGTIPPDMVTL